jgi:transcription termination factor Rho
VPPHLIRQYRLVDGATVTGPVETGKQGPQLAGVEQICGLTPEAFQQRPPFRQLTAIDPNQRFNLAAGGEVSMRLVDLISPIGRGTRGLIVAPPKAGKTILMEQIAKGILADDPAARLIILLIDERPEEVTHFRRALPAAEVFASSSDQPVREHTELSELMLAHIRTELECGRDVVVLVDSLTRLGAGLQHERFHPGRRAHYVRRGRCRSPANSAPLLWAGPQHRARRLGHDSGDGTGGHRLAHGRLYF